MRFNPKLAALALAASAAVATFNAQASIDVKVIGTISPGSCTPTMVGGGTVDFGNISPTLLSPTAYTVLPEKSVPFTLTCTAATRAGMRVIDNRTTSVVVGITPMQEESNFGLGQVANGDTPANVGGYTMHLTSSTLDGATAYPIYNNASGVGSWSPVQGSILSKRATQRYSWSRVNGTGATPDIFTTMTGSLDVTVYLNKSSALPMGDDIPLDGLATFEVVYL